MKRLFRSVVAVVVCVLALAPAAWGRMRFQQTGHPNDGYWSPAPASASRLPYIVLIVRGVPGGGWLQVIVTPTTGSTHQLTIDNAKRVLDGKGAGR